MDAFTKKALTATIVGLALGVTTAASIAPASAKWVDQTDAYCRHRGLMPPCAIWVTQARPRAGTLESTPTSPAPAFFDRGMDDETHHPRGKN